MLRSSLWSLPIAMVLAWPAEAVASGGYSNSFASTSFKYVYAETVRKSFADSSSSDAYFAERDRSAKGRFLRFRAKAEQAIAQAKKRGTAVGPLDLFLPAVRLKKPADVATLDPRAYPLNLLIDVSLPAPRAMERFEVTATGPWTVAQLTTLTAALEKLARVQPSDEEQEEEQATIAAAGFLPPPLAAVHLDQTFGLYVGTTTEVMLADGDRLRALLSRRLEQWLPAMRSRFKAAEAPAQLYLTKPLRPVQPLVDRHPQKLPGAFHPWGPLVSGDLIRLPVQVGGVAVIVMLAPDEKYEWSKVHPVLKTWLDAAINDPHLALVEREAERLWKDTEPP